MNDGHGVRSMLAGMILALVSTSASGVFEPVSIRDPEGQEVLLYESSHALVIGNSDYTAGWRDLPGAADDVAAVWTALVEHGFDVVVRQNLGRDALDKEIRNFINGQGAKSRVIVYFAGHGYTMKLATGVKMGYVVPVDAPDPRHDPDGFRAKAVPMTQFEVWAKGMQAKHALFLFDSCFSGSLFDLTRAPPEHISSKTARPVRQFITSGSADERVPDRSVFRQQLVAALAGEGDSDDDGYITGVELGEFLFRKVVNYSKGTQHPQYGRIKDPILDQGDFVFQLRRSPPPPPPPIDPEVVFWQSVKESDDDDELQAYLDRYPNGLFAKLARLRIEKLLPSPVAEGFPFFMIRSVTEADLEGMTGWALDVMRNEIFARHGRRFTRQDLQGYFDRQSWYRSEYLPHEFPVVLLTDVQRRNAQFISEYQRRSGRN